MKSTSGRRYAMISPALPAARRALFLLLLWGGLAPLVAAQDGVRPAPVGIHPEPPSYLLLRLAGDRTDVRYTPGSLDRAANLQTRLELTARAFQKWAEVDFRPRVFVLTREEWRQARYAVPYGLPVRVGEAGLAVPAAGDPGTVALWSELLGGLLPAVQGTPMRGTPEELATMVLADVFVQLLASDVLLDAIGLTPEEPWLRGVAAHALTLSVVARLEPGRMPSLEILYQRLGQRHAPGTMSLRDYGSTLDLADWLWFQAQLHAGGKALVAKGKKGEELKKGKELIHSLRKLQKRGGGVLTDELLLRRYRALRPWLSERFSAVSLRVD